jgi:hypothetical protein
MGDKKRHPTSITTFHILLAYTRIHTWGVNIQKDLNKLKVGAYYEYNSRRIDASGRLRDGHGDEPLDFI